VAVLEGPGVVGPDPPLHVAPLRLNVAGAGLDAPFQDALNPNVAVPLVAMLPFHAALEAVTALPL
jgi:hypothetical protein